MKLFRPLLLLSLAAAVVFVAVASAGGEIYLPRPSTWAGAADWLTAGVIAGAMQYVTIVLAMLATSLLVVAFVAAADRWWSRRRADRRLVFHDPWRPSEPYRRTPG
ncbi:MAG: hypothetical protein EOS24_33655 [Mesorhizobium sp.]|uniref:hypothetical protein n=1 Tax=Mesorhizobium sp. TaxID=1871066 RepID=UPI000FE7A3F2|nr:hypothetical protein [Mesorhizobium sp.]RWE51086.1 MAG: hypothetical protein EOS24_33655 [Mesorhizobium sp.]